MNFPSTLTVGGGTPGQVVTLTGVTSGTFGLIFQSDETTQLSWDATAAEVQAALWALPSIGDGNALVSGPNGGPYSVDFWGVLSNTGDEITADGANLEGTDPNILVAYSGGSGGVTYSQGYDYYLVRDTTLLSGTQLETSGLEWASTGPGIGTEIVFNYVYNQVPELLNAVIASSKQITTDVMVHQGVFIYIQPCFTIEYNRTYTVSTVNSAIFTQLQTYFTALPFGMSIKLSVLQMVVQQVNGVVSCEVTTKGQGWDRAPPTTASRSSPTAPVPTRCPAPPTPATSSSPTTRSPTSSA